MEEHSQGIRANVASFDTEQTSLYPASRSPTPEAPSWSPITPSTISMELPAVPFIPPLDAHRHQERPQEHRYQHGISRHNAGSRLLQTTLEPPLDHLGSASISQSDDIDAIALRSALDILQVQRLTAIKDIHALQRQKETALADTPAFVQALIGGQIDVRRGQRHAFSPLQQESSSMEAAILDSSRSNASLNEHQTPFEIPPTPQDVVRCPPVNWNKYRLNGQDLDMQHDAYKKRPSASPMLPSLDSDSSSYCDHVVAGPYRPFRDKV